MRKMSPLNRNSPQESDKRFGIMEREPEKLKAYTTVRQRTSVWTGGVWKELGDRYFEMPTKALQEEVKEFAMTGRQKTIKDRMDRYREVAVPKKKKQVEEK
jgi:hypothetical protein